MAATLHRSDRWIPWYFVAFFVVLAILDGIFVILATSTHTGVVTEHAYKKGLEYNQTIAAAEAQAMLGWQGIISFQQPELSFSLTNAEGMHIHNAHVTAYFNRATQAGYDFSIPLRYSETDGYHSNIHFPLKGAWDVRIVTEWNQQYHQQGKRLVVR